MLRLFLLLTILFSIWGKSFCVTPPPFFINLSTKTWGEGEPTSSDPEFIYNSASGKYEITIDYDLTQEDKYMRFYQKEGEVIKWWNPLVSTRQNMQDNKEYELYIEEDRNSPLCITSFYGNVDKAKLHISTIPNDTILYMRQIIEKEYIPEKLYIWGSDEGGVNTHVMGEMIQSTDDPYLYTAHFDLRAWSFNPASAMADFYSDAFVFFLSTSSDAKKGTVYRTYVPADTGDIKYSLISLEKDETFTTTLQTAVQDSGILVSVTPGRVFLTFNIKTYEFTATMIEPKNHVDVLFTGLRTALHNKYMDIRVNGADYPLFINPQKLWYDGDLDLIVSPKSGYGVTLEIISEDKDFILTPIENDCRLQSKENGLEILIDLFIEGELQSDCLRTP